MYAFQVELGPALCPPPPTGAPANANHLPGLWEEQSRHGSFAEHLTVSWGAGFRDSFCFLSQVLMGRMLRLRMTASTGQLP